MNECKVTITQWRLLIGLFFAFLPTLFPAIPWPRIDIFPMIWLVTKQVESHDFRFPVLIRDRRDIFVASFEALESMFPLLWNSFHKPFALSGSVCLNQTHLKIRIIWLTNCSRAKITGPFYHQNHAVSVCVVPHCLTGIKIREYLIFK